MAIYTVKRKTWYRGRGSETSRLLTYHKMRCCIGFVGQQCGIRDSQLEDISDVKEFKRQNQDGVWPEWMTQDDDGMESIYCVNDDEAISDDKREVRLKELFAAHGDVINFV